MHKVDWKTYEAENMTVFLKCILRTVKDQYAGWKFNMNYFTNKSRKYNYPGWEAEDLIAVVAIAMKLAFALVLCVPGLHGSNGKLIELLYTPEVCIMAEEPTLKGPGLL